VLREVAKNKFSVSLIANPDITERRTNLPNTKKKKIPKYGIYYFTFTTSCCRYTGI
jgi:hypothetical protein